MQRLAREHDARAWTVWHIEALRRTKRIPKLEKLLSKKSKPRQSWQDQLRIMDMWATATRHLDGAI